MIKSILAIVFAVIYYQIANQKNTSIIYINIPQKEKIKVAYSNHGAHTSLFIIVNHDWKRNGNRSEHAINLEHQLYFQNNNVNDRLLLFEQNILADSIKKKKKITLNDFAKLLNTTGAFNIYTQKIGLIVPSEKSSYKIYYVKYYETYPDE